LVVADDRRDVDPKVWTPGHFAVIKAAASDPLVQRIFVNPAIKKALCREAGSDRAWLEKVRPWWGHDYHFTSACAAQATAPNASRSHRQAEVMAAARSSNSWFTEAVLHTKAAVGAGKAEAGQAQCRASRRPAARCLRRLTRMRRALRSTAAWRTDRD